LGDKVGGPCSYRDDVEPSAVSETSIPLPQHPLCEIPAPLADPQHGQGRARPPTDPFCQGEKVLETPKGRGGGIAETNRHLGGIRARTGYPAIRLVHTAGVARVDLLIRRVRRLSRPDCHGGGACAAPPMCRATNRLDWAADLRCGHRGRRRIPLAVIAMATGAALVMTGIAWFWPSTRSSPMRPAVVGTAAENARTVPSVLEPAVAPRLSIVVLPFANLSNDPEQQYFADGVTEDLTTDLSRISHMLVISRNTAFTYKDKPVNAKQIGRELGVRYVLEGSVRRSGNQVRVSAQLIDVATDTHLWAERFDRDTSELFALQNDITRQIAVALNSELVSAEAARPTEHPDALDYISVPANWRARH